MKPSTRLDLCILAGALMVILCVVLWVTTEKQEPKAWSVEQQCMVWNKYCVDGVCGGCE